MIAEEVRELYLICKVLIDGLVVMHIVEHLLSMSLGALLMYVFLKLKKDKEKKRRRWKLWWFNR